MVYHTKSTDPAYNLALEETLLNNSVFSYILVWQSDNAVIVGKNQVTVNELDTMKAESFGTKVFRRISGGGSVYHDVGNVNFSYIESNTTGEGSFKYYTSVVIDYLATLGVEAQFAGRNDIVVDGKKISGNAQHISGKRIIHHGTLLFNSNLEYASDILTPDNQKMKNKGISSVKSRIANIKDYISKDITTDEFIEGLIEYLVNHSGQTLDKPSQHLLDKANELAKTKYLTDEWNYGLSPKYDLIYTKSFPFGTVTVTLNVKDAVIEQAHISGDFFGIGSIENFSNSLVGRLHNKEAMMEPVKDIGYFINGMTPQDFLNMIF